MAPTVAGSGHGDIFLSVKGARCGVIKGESQDSVHANEIDVVSWSWGMQAKPSLGGGAASGKAAVHELKVLKRVDAASTALMQALRTNELISKAVLTQRKAGRGALEFLKITIEQGRVTSLTLDGGGNGAATPDVLENVSFSFNKISIEYVPQGPDGHGAGRGRGTVFALHEHDFWAAGAPVVAPDELPHLFDFRVRFVRVGAVAVVGQDVDQVERGLFFEYLEKLPHPVQLGHAGHTEGDEPGVGLDTFHEPGRADVKVTQLGTRVERVAVGFVPDFPLGYLGLVARDHRPHPIVPGGQALRRSRDAAHEFGFAPAFVNRVAVRQFDPGRHAPAGRVGNHRVEPGEVVHAFHFFALGPAALQSDALGTQRAEVGFVRLVVGVVAVEGFTADAPGTRLDFFGIARFELTPYSPVGRYLRLKEVRSEAKK